MQPIGFGYLNDSRPPPTVNRKKSLFFDKGAFDHVVAQFAGVVVAHLEATRIEHGRGRPDDIDALNRIADNIQGRTICALGEAASMPVLNFVKKFGPEFEYFIEHGRSMHDGRLVV